MIVPVVNLKGGCGKTTAAIALATAAAQRGLRAAVYDADPQGSATDWAMVAAEAGDPLPFEVRSANIAVTRRMRSRVGEDEWAFVDCPPSGAVTDEAVRAADFVVVPTSPSPIDLEKTWETCASLRAQGAPYAILLCQAEANTRTLRFALQQLDDRGESYFETVVPKRQALASFYGNAFGSELYGYGEVLAEIEEAVSRWQ